MDDTAVCNMNCTCTFHFAFLLDYIGVIAIYYNVLPILNKVIDHFQTETDAGKSNILQKCIEEWRQVVCISLFWCDITRSSRFYSKSKLVIKKVLQRSRRNDGKRNNWGGNHKYNQVLFHAWTCRSKYMCSTTSETMCMIWLSYDICVYSLVWVTTNTNQNKNAIICYKYWNSAHL